MFLKGIRDIILFKKQIYINVILGKAFKINLFCIKWKWKLFILKTKLQFQWRARIELTPTYNKVIVSWAELSKNNLISYFPVVFKKKNNNTGQHYIAPSALDKLFCFIYLPLYIFALLTFLGKIFSWNKLTLACSCRKCFTIRFHTIF